MANMSNYLRDALGRQVLLEESYTPPETLYLALYTAAPDETGGGTEVDSGGYARVSITFVATATDGAFDNELTSISDMPEVSITGLAILDAVTAGNFLFFEDFTASPVSVQAGDTYVVAAGDVGIAFS